MMVTVLLLLPCTIQSMRTKNMKNASSRLFSISMCCTRYTAVACNYISGDVIANFRSATRMYRTYVTRFGWWIMKRMRTREDTRALIPVHNNYTNTWHKRISIYSISGHTAHTHTHIVVVVVIVHDTISTCTRTSTRTHTSRNEWISHRWATPTDAKTCVTTTNIVKWESEDNHIHQRESNDVL